MSYNPSEDARGEDARAKARQQSRCWLCDEVAAYLVGDGGPTDGYCQACCEDYAKEEAETDRGSGSQPCLVCGKPCPYGSKQDVAHETHPCVSGTRFEATGNYGSKRFDPLRSGGYFLQVVVCDRCVLDCANKGRIDYVQRVQPRPIAERKKWNPRTDHG